MSRILRVLDAQAGKGPRAPFNSGRASSLEVVDEMRRKKARGEPRAKQSPVSDYAF